MSLNMSLSVDDLVSSFSSSHIGQEAIDLAALQVSLPVVCMSSAHSLLGAACTDSFRQCETNPKPQFSHLQYSCCSNTVFKLFFPAADRRGDHGWRRRAHGRGTHHAFISHPRVTVYFTHSLPGPFIVILSVIGWAVVVVSLGVHINWSFLSRDHAAAAAAVSLNVVLCTEWASCPEFSFLCPTGCKTAPASASRESPSFTHGRHVAFHLCIRGILGASASHSIRCVVLSLLASCLVTSFHSLTGNPLPFIYHLVVSFALFPPRHCMHIVGVTH